MVLPSETERNVDFVSEGARVGPESRAEVEVGVSAVVEDVGEDGGVVSVDEVERDSGVDDGEDVELLAELLVRAGRVEGVTAEVDDVLGLW